MSVKQLARRRNLARTALLMMQALPWFPAQAAVASLPTTSTSTSSIPSASIPTPSASTSVESTDSGTHASTGTREPTTTTAWPLRPHGLRWDVQIGFGLYKVDPIGVGALEMGGALGYSWRYCALSLGGRYFVGRSREGLWFQRIAVGPVFGFPLSKRTDFAVETHFVRLAYAPTDGRATESGLGYGMYGKVETVVWDNRSADLAVGLRAGGDLLDAIEVWGGGLYVALRR